MITQHCWICLTHAGPFAEVNVPNQYNTDISLMQVCFNPDCLRTTASIIDSVERQNIRSGNTNDFNSFAAFCNSATKPLLLEPEEIDLLKAANRSRPGSFQEPDFLTPTSDQESDAVYPLCSHRVPSIVPASLEAWCKKQTPSFWAGEVSMKKMVDSITKEED